MYPGRPRGHPRERERVAAESKDPVVPAIVDFDRFSRQTRDIVDAQVAGFRRFREAAFDVAGQLGKIELDRARARGERNSTFPVFRSRPAGHLRVTGPRKRRTSRVRRGYRYQREAEDREHAQHTSGPTAREWSNLRSTMTERTTQRDPDTRPARQLPAGAGTLLRDHEPAVVTLCRFGFGRFALLPLKKELQRRFLCSRSFCSCASLTLSSASSRNDTAPARSPPR